MKSFRYLRRGFLGSMVVMTQENYNQIPFTAKFEII